jgi:hypothetical protein
LPVSARTTGFFAFLARALRGIVPTTALLAGVLLASGCSPTYNWREVRGETVVGDPGKQGEAEAAPAASSPPSPPSSASPPLTSPPTRALPEPSTDRPAAYRVLMPAKPASFTREVDLDGLRVSMTMQAARVEGVTFAVAQASLPADASPQAALRAMRRAMLANIQAAPATSDASGASGDATGPDRDDPTRLAVDTAGRGADGKPVRLTALFVSRGNRVFQAMALGAAQDWPAEAVQTFLESFAPG